MDNREKALAIVNAYFDNKIILIKDYNAGISDWVSIKYPGFLTDLECFIKDIDKYKIVNDNKI